MLGFVGVAQSQQLADVVVAGFDGRWHPTSDIREVRGIDGALLDISPATHRVANQQSTHIAACPAITEIGDAMNTVELDGVIDDSCSRVDCPQEWSLIGSVAELALWGHAGHVGLARS